MDHLAAIKPFLSVDELRERFRTCEDPRLKVQWQVLWLRAQGRRTKEVATVTGFRPDWVRRLVRRYNEGGPDAIRDYVKDNGREPFLDEQMRAELFEALKAEPPDGGLWSGPKVARWVAERTGRPAVCPQTGWEYLVRLGFTLQRPRPRHLAARDDGQRWS